MGKSMQKLFFLSGGEHGDFKLNMDKLMKKRTRFHNFSPWEIRANVVAKPSGR